MHVCMDILGRGLYLLYLINCSVCRILNFPRAAFHICIYVCMYVFWCVGGITFPPSTLYLM